MPSPQTEYSYEDLSKYKDASLTALQNFEERYPDLSFEYVNPEQIAIRILKDFANDVNQRFVEDNAYLEDFETDAIPIGSVVGCQHDKQKEKHLRELQLATRAFEKDLANLYKINIAQIALILSRLKAISTKFTADRIDKHEWHKEWVRKQQKYYEYYHIKECSKFRASRGLDFHYIDRINDAPENPGIYFLFQNGNIIYIGHSANIRKRLSNHSIVRKSYFKTEENVYNIDCVYAEIPVEEAQSIERELIRVAKPILNSQGKPNDF